MGMRAPRVGDNIEILRTGLEGAAVSEGDIFEIVGMSAGGSRVVVPDGNGGVWTFAVSQQGIGFKNLTVHDSQTRPWAPTTQTGVQNMKKQAFNVLILQHMPVPGIPETTADIETTKVFGPEMVLAVNGESAKALAMRKLDESVNVEYIEVLIRPF